MSVPETLQRPVEGQAAQASVPSSVSSPYQALAFPVNLPAPKPQGNAIVLGSLQHPLLSVVQSIRVRIRRRKAQVVAEWPDAQIEASGNTVVEALFRLRGKIVDISLSEGGGCLSQWIVPARGFIEPSIPVEVALEDETEVINRPRPAPTEYELWDEIREDL